MSNDFNPGEGWRPWVPGTVLKPPYVKVVSGDSADVIWVREDPVPPLPTEPYTFIVVTSTASQPAPAKTSSPKHD